jgi:hypothetical protein
MAAIALRFIAPPAPDESNRVFFRASPALLERMIRGVFYSSLLASLERFISIND